MIKRAAKRHGGFKTERLETEIIGGKTDFCAERFGYKREINGISPALSESVLVPTLVFYYADFAEYLPLSKVTILVTVYGRYYKWKFGDSTVSSLGVVSTRRPVVHPCISDGEYKYVLTSGEYLLKIKTDGTIQNIKLGVKLFTSTMHCGRIFGCEVDDRYKIVWSGYEVDDWTMGPDKAGYIRLNSRLGMVLDMFSMGEKIIVVREYGITVLSTLGDSRHMRIAPNDMLNLPLVYVHSSAICRGQLWIYTQAGMYVFDGNTLSKAPFDEIMTDYTLDKPKVVDDRYIYYSAKLNGNKCLFMYDVETGAGTPFAKGCHTQYFTPEGSFCFNGDTLRSLSEEIDDPDRKWVSKPCDLGTDKTKTLKRLLVEGSGNPNVEIDCDGRKLHAYGVGGTNFSESGRTFTFKVTGVGSVTRLVAEWEVRK